MDLSSHSSSYSDSPGVDLDVLCVGHAALDIVMTVDHHPGPDEKCSASSMILCGGGPAANAAVTVARLGGRSGFLGYLGNDSFGLHHIEELKREGVRVDWVVTGALPSPVSVILVKPDGSRTVVNHKAQTESLTPDQVDLSACNPKVVLFDGHEPHIAPKVLKHTAALGAKTILDGGSVHRGTVDLLSAVDYVVASRAFAMAFAANADVVSALLELKRHASWAAVTLGPEGVLWDDGTGIRKQGAFSIQAVDTTGAGDVFHGAFSLGIARGVSPAESLRFASAAAALACEHLGGRPGIPRGPEVVRLLRGESVCVDSGR